MRHDTLEKDKRHENTRHSGVNLKRQNQLAANEMPRGKIRNARFKPTQAEVAAQTGKPINAPKRKASPRNWHHDDNSLTPSRKGTQARFTESSQSPPAEIWNVNVARLPEAVAVRQTDVPESCPGLSRISWIPRQLTEKSDKTIILDMDETLIHTQWNLCFYHFTINIQDTDFCVAKRPGLREFLEFCKRHFRDVVLWTASRRQYADKILDEIDPAGDYFTRRLYDTDCRLGGKRLNSLQLNPANVIFVDDQPGHFVVNLQDLELCERDTHRPKFYANQYLISPFDGDPEDRGLFQAMQDFFGLMHSSDVRETFLKNHACVIMDFLTETRGFNFDRWSHVYQDPLEVMPLSQD